MMPPPDDRDYATNGGMRRYEGLQISVRSNHEQSWTEADLRFMRLALDLARRAEREGEIPVGAVVVQDGAAIGQGWNHPVATNDPTSHAEIEALRAAASLMRNYRLPETTLYVTLEPCAMCAGALVAARVERLVFAARDIRFGAVRSKFALADSELLNHRVRVEEGLLAAESADLLANFFRGKRL